MHEEKAYDILNNYNKSKRGSNSEFEISVNGDKNIDYNKAVKIHPIKDEYFISDEEDDNYGKLIYKTINTIITKIKIHPRRSQEDARRQKIWIIGIF